MCLGQNMEISTLVIAQSFSIGLLRNQMMRTRNPHHKKEDSQKPTTANVSQLLISDLSFYVL